MKETRISDGMVSADSLYHDIWCHVMLWCYVMISQYGERLEGNGPGGNNAVGCANANAFSLISVVYTKRNEATDLDLNKSRFHIWPAFLDWNTFYLLSNSPYRVAAESQEHLQCMDLVEECCLSVLGHSLNQYQATVLLLYHPSWTLVGLHYYCNLTQRGLICQDLSPLIWKCIN